MNRERTAGSHAEELLDCLDAVVYGDVFDCAVSRDEIRCYAGDEISEAGLREHLSLAKRCGIVEEHDDFCFLAGRGELAARRARRRVHAAHLRARGRAVARILQHCPFVRAIYLTGSVAAADADESADVDMLMVVADGRLALVFALLAPLSRLLSRDVFCPNYYVSEAHLAMRRRDRYVARELVQSEPLAGDACRLMDENRWALDLFPNAPSRSKATRPMPGGRLLQRLLEWPLRGAFGDRLDRRTHALVKRRLTAHHARYDEPVPEKVLRQFDEGVELRFHGAPLVDAAMQRYAQRRDQLCERLREALPQVDGGGRTHR